MRSQQCMVFSKVKSPDAISFYHWDGEVIWTYQDGVVRETNCIPSLGIRTRYGQHPVLCVDIDTQSSRAHAALWYNMRLET
jgi:hypothetical protein